MSTQDSGNSHPLFPALCKNGCGFFGGMDNQGYCSVCFKEKMKKETATAAETEQATESSTAPSEDTTVEQLGKLTLEEKAEIEEVKEDLVAKVDEELQKISSEVEGATAAASVEIDKEKEEPKDTKKKKNRCLSCKKKVGLTGFSCRCGGLFCSIHRYSDKHECNFDYKAMGEKEISEANPVVVAQKLNKI